jgi:hypothetical protein
MAHLLDNDSITSVVRKLSSKQLAGASLSKDWTRACKEELALRSKAPWQCALVGGHYLADEPARLRDDPIPLTPSVVTIDIIGGPSGLSALPGGVYDDTVPDEHDWTHTVMDTDEGLAVPGLPPLTEEVHGGNLAGGAWICEDVFMHGVVNAYGDWNGYACQKGSDWVSVGSFTSHVSGDAEEEGFVIANCIIKGMDYAVVSHAMRWPEPLPDEPYEYYFGPPGPAPPSKELRWMGVPVPLLYDAVALGYESPTWIDVTRFVGTKLRGSAKCVRFWPSSAQEVSRAKPCVRCLDGDDEGLVLSPFPATVEGLRSASCARGLDR